MKNTHQFPSEIAQKSDLENSNIEELNDSELDAIAGGIRTITVEGPAPDYLRPRISTQLYNALLKSFGQ